MTDLLKVSPEELRKLGKGSKAQAGLAWYDLSVLLWRVEHEGLFEPWGYASARAYAQDELGIPPQDFKTLLDLAKMVIEAGAAVQPAEWGKLSKAKAMLVKKVSALGGDCKQWVAKATESKSATEFGKTVLTAMGGKPEEWVKWVVWMPAELAEVGDAAVIMALHKALPDDSNPAKELAQDRNVRFKCLEVILTEWIQLNATVDNL